MAKIKLQGHASGTGVLTLTAPNTSTDRTITLPDATGTLLNSDGSGANLTSLPADSSKVDKANPTITNDLTIDDSSSTPTINFRESDGTLKMKIGFGTTTTDLAEWNVSPAKDIAFVQNSTTNLTIKSDGRGLSQFTAKMWIRFNGKNTAAINDSHNVSSLQDLGTGNYYVHIDVDMANGSGSTTASGSAGMEDDGWDGNCIALMVNAATIRVYSTAGGSLTDASVICVTGFGD